ncbi:hypothetical protein [Conexibacter woesei]|uniref:Uncharacterized protein n=1 Tax=Conexibacter woesei (strain DSM 14684 / CCUG 47730 / CIP 108061 / JCM 11494 / NBRC 100937 / ID131577) TaxID=469383 RepID=D3F1F0_CONWI|nr:hypothetical protein [Conexibacter woesei]ADB52113.1 hypothetical protein Cwoe_3696 [Conexibacter woesei DSM 14684]
MRERRGRERRGRGRRRADAWQETADPVPLADAAVADELAREAAGPFGYKRPARELLARFGGEGDDARRRATAALQLSGVVADPPLAEAAPHQFVQLRRATAAPGVAPAPPAAAAPARADAFPTADAPVPPAAGSRAAAAPPAAGAPEAEAAPPAQPAAARPLARIAGLLRAGYSIRRRPAAGPAPDVPRNRRIAAGALGLGALALLMVVVVLLRSLAGDGDETVDALPAGTTATQTTAPASTATAPAPSRTTSAAPRTHTTTAPPARTSRTTAAPARTPTPTPPAPAGTATTATRAVTDATPKPRRRPATVRLRIVPTEPSYVCVADADSGRTLVNEVLEAPYVVRRPKLILRVGVGTARIDANGRPIRVPVAPGAFELTPAATRPLPGDRLVCGG